MDSLDSKDDSPQTHHFRWLMLGGVWLIYFCFGLTVTSLAPLVRPVTRDLEMSYSEMGSVLGAWQLIYILTALPCGALVARIGLRRSLLICSIVMGMSFTLRAFTVDHMTLFLSVALFGFGGPLVSIGAPKLISLWFMGRERGLAMGIYVTGPAFGGITSLSLTNSVMMPWLDGAWRDVVLVYGIIVFLSGLAWFLISRNPVSLKLETFQRRQPRPAQLKVFAELFSLAPVKILLLLSIGTFLYNHGLNNWMHEILQTHGMEADLAGYWASLPTLIGILGALTIPRLALPRRRIWILVLLFSAAGSSALLLQSDQTLWVLLGLILKGITQGSMMTILLLVLMEIPEVGSRHTGSAGGMFFAAAEIGGVLGPFSLGVFSDQTGSFNSALMMLAMVCMMLVLLTIYLRSMLDREGGVCEKNID